jgi:hypothetical protein
MATSSSRCAKCNPGGPTAAAVEFSGPVPAGGMVFHDVAVPSGTDGVDLVVQWTPSSTQLRVIQTDPNCDPIQKANCEPFSDPWQPRPDGSPTTIQAQLNHQGSAALGRVRFIIRNLAGNAAVYRAYAMPERNGCDR